MSRASMDEFHHIVETNPVFMKSYAEPQVREVGEPNTITGGGNSSSQSSIVNVPIDGIRTQTTIEMSVMSQTHDVSDKASDSSGNDYSWDVERGVPKSTL